MDIQGARSQTTGMVLRDAAEMRVRAGGTDEAASGTRAVPRTTADRPGTIGADGPGSVRLSSAVAGALMRASQTVDGAADGAAVPRWLASHLDRIAADPAYAAEQAASLATGPGELIAVERLPENGAPDSVWRSFQEDMSRRSEQVRQVRDERNAAYERLRADGTPPAETYAALLRFNAGLPASYDAVVGFSTYSDRSWTEHHAAAAAYLDSAIARGDPAS